MKFNPSEDDNDSDEFDLRPPCPDLIDGPLPDFEILGLLGSGGMGKVYKARQPNLDRVVALKILTGSPENDSLFRFGERFQREATAMARLRHPNIVSFYHYGETEEGQVYFVMEYVEGAELTDYIRSSEAEPRHILYWAIQICNALQFAHECGIVHRDIKPSNLLIDGRGDVKIADFGLAKFSQRDENGAEMHLTRTDVVVGTPNFIAPELLDDPSAVTPACDLYSVGVTLYLALTHTLPRGVPSPPSQLSPGLDPRWDGILFKCLSGNPEERFQSATDLQSALEDLLDGSDLVPTASLRAPIPQRGRATPPSGSLRWKRLSLITITVCLVALVTFLGLKRWQSPAADAEMVPSAMEDGRRVPPTTTLRLTLPVRPTPGGKPALLEFHDEPGGSVRVEALESPNDLVQIWEQPGGRGVSGLRHDGSLWTWPEEPEVASPELTDLVWLAPGENSIGALRADGRCFLWNRGENPSPVDGSESFVMIAMVTNGRALLLSREGGVRWSKNGETIPAEAVPFIAEECLAIGAYGDLMATLSRSGFLRVWRVRDGSRTSPELVFERKSENGIRREDPQPSPYPDRWIPIFSWAVVGPHGEIFPFSEETPVESLPMLDSIRPATFRFGDSLEDEHVRRTGGVWVYSGPWERNRISTLERFSEGAVQITFIGSSALALFPPALEVAARFEEMNTEVPEPAETDPRPDSIVEERSWSSDRVEIRTRGAEWDEATARDLLNAIEKYFNATSALLSRWGATGTPPKLIIQEGSAEPSPTWESGTIQLASGRLDALLETVKQRELTPSDLDFLPAAEAFRSIARKVDPPDSSAGFFGETESHLAHFSRLFAMKSSSPSPPEPLPGGDDWAEKKAFLASLVSREDHRPDEAMKDPQDGERYLSGLLARLHDDCGGAPFLDRFFGRELPALPDPSEPDQGVDNFVVAASFAAQRNLIPYFRDELRWPLSREAVEAVAHRYPAPEPTEVEVDFRPAPDDLLTAWEKSYESDILPLTVTLRRQGEELRLLYRDALQRKFAEYVEAGKASAAAIFREERDRVEPGYVGPDAFHPVRHRGLDPAAQEAVREIAGGLGRTYRERLRTIAAGGSSAAGGKMVRTLDELYRLQHLFTLEGKDPAAQWAFDRREREVKTHSLESVYSPRIPLDFALRYEEMIRWAVEEGASVDLVQPITPTQVQRYTVRSIADVQAGRFVWQRLRILGIRRGAEDKPWSDIHLELISRFKDLEALECGCGELKGTSLEAISGLTELTSLSLRGVEIDAMETEGLAAIGRMKLEKLSLVGAELPREALAILSAGPISATLEELQLANTETVDLLPLSDFRKLKRLDITGCPVPQANIEQFNRVRRDCLVVK